MTFPIRLDWPFRLPLLLFGVIGGRNAYVRIDAGRLTARFGFFSVGVPLANVEHWRLEPAYRWWRSVGVRGTVMQPEMTFGGSAHGGIRLTLRRQQSLAWWPWGLARFYITLEDPAALGAALEREGIRRAT